MTSYFSLTFFLVFLPVTALAYSAMPQKARWTVLLAASYLFYWCLSGALIGFIAASTVSVYLCGRRMTSLLRARNAALAEAQTGKRKIKNDCKKRMRRVLAAGIVFNLAMLVILKYLGLLTNGANALLSLFGAEASLVAPAIAVPIGISFYTLMAVSYLVDVYRETAQADRHLGRVALFLSFFPQIMEGPICRYGQTAAALTAGEPIRAKNLYRGALRVLFGLAKKIVVADRLNAFVKTVFDGYSSYDGSIIALAAVLYTLQLYCDFSGTMDIALGIGRIFNVSLPENFRQPFFSRTSSEFWKRWHITLGTWFKDYVYYPVSLSRPCKRITSAARKRFGVRYGPLLASSIAMLCVWTANGLWHGAGLQYLFFGLYYFTMIMAGGFIEPAAQAAAARLKINRNSTPYRTFQVARTLVIIFVGELFFRANGLDAGLEMFASMVTGFSFDPLINGTVFSLGLDRHDFAIVAFAVAVLIAVGVAKERGRDVGAVIADRGSFIRCCALVLLFVAIVVFGAYGVGYTPVDPMYAQF